MALITIASGLVVFFFAAPWAEATDAVWRDAAVALTWAVIIIIVAAMPVVCFIVLIDGAGRGRVRRYFGDAERRHSLALASFILLVPFGLPAIFIGMQGGGVRAGVLGAWLTLTLASVVDCARALREIRRRERGRACPNCGYPRENPHDIADPARLDVACPECGAQNP